MNENMYNGQQTELATVPSSVLPEVIRNIQELTKASEKVERAMTAAKAAKDKAEEAKSKSAGWSLFGKDKRVAIEALQESGVELSKGISEIADAQKQMFDNMNEMAKATKKLFGLGVMNIATTRVVIDTITNDLKDASKFKINEKARESLMSVVEQLKAQEDLFNKIERLSGKCNRLQGLVQTLQGYADAPSSHISLYGLATKTDEIKEELRTTDKRIDEVRNSAIQSVNEEKNNSRQYTDNVSAKVKDYATKSIIDAEARGKKYTDEVCDKVKERAAQSVSDAEMRGKKYAEVLVSRVSDSAQQSVIDVETRGKKYIDEIVEEERCRSTNHVAESVGKVEQAFYKIVGDQQVKIEKQHKYIVIMSVLLIISLVLSIFNLL